MDFQAFEKRYQFDPKKKLDKGGQGSIFRGFDTETNTTIIIKRADVDNTKGDKYSVQEEWNRAKTLPPHKNIPKYYNHYRIESNVGTAVDFGIMEFIGKGENLDDFIKSFPTEQNLKEVLIGILEGISHLHAHDIIHRDLKPKNILIAYDNDGIPIPKIIDFGISRQIGDDTTFASVIAGTTEYMAPEQIDSSVPLRKNVDIWAFGAIVYRIFTGGFPFGSSEDNTSQTEIRKNILNSRYTPPKLNTIEGVWKKIVKKCLEKNSDKRFSEAEDILKIIRNHSDPTVRSGFFDGTSIIGLIERPFIKKSITPILIIIFLAFGSYFAFQALTPAPTLEEAKRLFNENKFEKSFQVLERLEESNATINYLFGRLYSLNLNNLSFQPNDSTAIEYLKKSNSVEALILLGEIYYRKKTKADSLRGKDIHDKAKRLFSENNANNTLFTYEEMGNYYAVFEKDGKRAKRYYNVAIDSLSSQSMKSLGDLYYEGSESIAKNINKAIFWYKKATDKNNPWAAYQLGLIKENENLKTEAGKQYKIALKSALPQAYAKLGYGYLFEDFGLDYNEEKAFKYLEIATESNIPEAQYYLGLIYENGLSNIDKNSEMAISYFKKAANKNFGLANYKLFKIYTEGDLIEQNEKKAKKFLEKANALGEPKAQYELGRNYAEGLMNYEKNPQKAFRLYQKAANNGNYNAQTGLGVFYESGYGTSKNLNKAAKWYKKAAIQEHPQAQFNYGRLFNNRKSGIFNRDSSIYWYDKAAKNGYSKADIELTKLR